MSAQPVLPAYGMNLASFPWMYERSLATPLFQPWAESLLDAAALTPAARVIDVACGTGIVARLAHRRGVRRVVGVDISAPMLEVAQAVEPGVEWRVGDAAALPVGGEERFDFAFCQQGVQFFADRAAAVRELRRVLAPGGTLLLSVWRSADEMPAYRTLQRIAERHVGPVQDQRYAFGDGGTLTELLRDAGFQDVDVRTRTHEHSFADGRDFVRMNAMALVGMSGARLADGERERVLDSIVAESLEAARPYMQGAAFVCEMRANVAHARAAV